MLIRCCIFQLQKLPAWPRPATPTPSRSAGSDLSPKRRNEFAQKAETEIRFNLRKIDVKLSYPTLPWPALTLLSLSSPKLITYPHLTEPQFPQFLTYPKFLAYIKLKKFSGTQVENTELEHYPPRNLIELQDYSFRGRNATVQIATVLK